MIDEPEAFTARAVDAETEQLVAHAETLGYQLRVFDDGERYGNPGSRPRSICVTNRCRISIWASRRVRSAKTRAC
jgi:hypothetical protein